MHDGVIWHSSKGAGKKLLEHFDIAIGNNCPSKDMILAIAYTIDAYI